LIKNPNLKVEKATIHYYDEEKLRILQKFQSVDNQLIMWQTLQPNEQGDWISQRSNTFESLISIGDKDAAQVTSFFNPYYGRGLATSRDAWCYNSSNLPIADIRRAVVPKKNAPIATIDAYRFWNVDFGFRNELIINRL
jgi:predicted helicase